MKKSVIILIAVVAVIIIWAISAYNGLVSMDENVSSQWANVETQYQRRADLIPNLVNAVKGYASHEKETLEGVVEAREIKLPQIKSRCQRSHSGEVSRISESTGSRHIRIGQAACHYRKLSGPES